MDEELEVENHENDALLSLSDDEIMNMTDAPAVGEELPTEVAQEEEETTETEGEETTEEEVVEEEEKPVKGEKPKTGTEATTEETATAEGEELTAEGTETEVAQELDYGAVGKELMAPFKANGKEIVIKTPEEARKLMQMGANYTKKMQALQPHLKVVQMLENNNLLDETKLSYLIDLDKKNPGAIQKLIKDSGIEPLDIDYESNKDYTPNDYAVSDQDVNFTQVIQDIFSEPEGQEVIQELRTQWDKQSKDAAVKHPEVLRHLTAQKKTGVFQIIDAEVNRQKVLGNLDNVSYLDAYYQIGSVLNQQGQLNGNAQAKVIATRTEKPKTEVSNSEKAKAAAPTRVTSKTQAKSDFNPLAMSDDDFLKSELAQTL